MYILQYGRGAKINLSGGLGRGTRAAEKAMTSSERWILTAEQRINYIINLLTKKNISKRFTERELGSIVLDSKGMSLQLFQTLVETRIKNLLTKPNGFIGKANLVADKMLGNKKLMLGASALALGTGLVSNLNMFSGNNSDEESNDQLQNNQDGLLYQNGYLYTDGDYSGGSGYNLDYSLLDMASLLTSPNQNIGNEWFSVGTPNNAQYAKLLYNSTLNNLYNNQYFTYTKDNSILNNLSYYHGLYL